MNIVHPKFHLERFRAESRNSATMPLNMLNMFRNNNLLYVQTLDYFLKLFKPIYSCHASNYIWNPYYG